MLGKSPEIHRCPFPPSSARINSANQVPVWHAFPVNQGRTCFSDMHLMMTLSWPTLKTDHEVLPFGPLWAIKWTLYRSPHEGFMLISWHLTDETFAAKIGIGVIKSLQLAQSCVIPILCPELHAEEARNRVFKCKLQLDLLTRWQHSFLWRE